MRITISSILITLLIQYNAHGDSFRTFSDKSGREIEACLKSYNPRTDLAKVELKNKSIRTVKSTIFSQADQDYIQDWYAADSLLSGKTVTFSVNKKNIISDSYHGYLNGWHSVYPCMKFKDVAYELLIENRSGQDLRNIEVEYCVYHQCTIDEEFTKTEFRSDGDASGYYLLGTEELPRRIDKNHTTGHWSIPSLPNKSKLEKLTKEIRLRKGSEFKSDRNKNTRSTREIDAELIGIRVRLSIPLKSGEKAMREYSFPSDLIKLTEWKTNKN